MAGELTSLQELEELNSFRGLVVLHFWASWSDPCKQMQEAMEELAKENTGVKFYKVVAEDVPDLSIKFEVIAVPTFILLKGGEVVDRVNGAHVPELAKKTASHSKYPTLSTAPPPVQPPSQEDLDTRLKKLINSAPCILFIKGTTKEPRCKFSRAIVDILQELGAEFNTFNILMDDVVRQGLKKFSNWPTYPQLYINGELIGGLDIIKEMKESGELNSLIPKPRLKDIINRHDVMLFMKGTPETPRCGFSKTICGILKDTGVIYGTFDILEDEEVRQSLKKFSNWPTYPQLYVKGEFIGGLDIVKELLQSDELNETLGIIVIR